MKVPIYQIDAFADRVFSGNPAAVCPLRSWPRAEFLQAIAMENNLSETAFVVRQDQGWAIRWFTPAAEVDLCGHATLAAAYVIGRHLQPGCREVRFSSRGGPLSVAIGDGRYTLDFPSRRPEAVAATTAAQVSQALGAPAGAVFACDYYMAVFASEREISALTPDMSAVAALDRIGVIATAPGEQVDFVSRFFGPALGVPEDPVTGSAHCMLTPYWAERHGKNSLVARQVSARGGTLWCEMRGDRVGIGGGAVQFLDGTIELGDDPEQHV